MTSENIDEKEAEVKSALAYFEAWRMACFSWSFEAKAKQDTKVSDLGFEENRQRLSLTSSLRETETVNVDLPRTL